MWNKLLLWWSEPPLTFWAILTVTGVKLAPPERHVESSWAAVPLLGWTPAVKIQGYTSHAQRGDFLAFVGPFPELADAEKFCVTMDGRGAAPQQQERFRHEPPR